MPELQHSTPVRSSTLRPAREFHGKNWTAAPGIAVPEMAGPVLGHCIAVLLVPATGLPGQYHPLSHAPKSGPREVGPAPPSLYEWRSWLLREKLSAVYSPYVKCTRWGWVTKENECEIKILLHLAQLAEETPAGLRYLFRPIHFQFCLAATLLHESTHLITKFAFRKITPKVAGTILRFGEAGESFEYAMFGGKLVCEWDDFEHAMLGGKLVCEWDDGHVADLKHLRRLLLRRLGENPMDYVLEEEDLASFLEKISNPTPDTVFEFNFEQKQPSVTPPGTIRTTHDGERLRGICQGKKVVPPGRMPDVTPPGRIRTGPMLGIGRCYHRPAGL
ncbi:hypothetical protein GGX14DRAFT_656768 [Mycena pura]|uniref:Uncharacterized protein n=1 Tax=Mycena pura TaxID=153505 RepID=A0AAD6V2Z4_9AGAR|nr:hypothetical protein GGX14DRAFT_656768 [Mycena pura]